MAKTAGGEKGSPVKRSAERWVGKPKRKVGRDVLVCELRLTYSQRRVYALLGNLSSDIMRIVIYRHLFPGRDSRFTMPAEKFEPRYESSDVYRS